MGVTRLLLLGPFYSIQTNFLYFFAHDCKKRTSGIIGLRNKFLNAQANKKRLCNLTSQNYIIQYILPGGKFSGVLGHSLETPNSSEL